MAQYDTPRPVSGEIMAEPSARRAARAGPAGIVEAEYESVLPATSPADAPKAHRIAASGLPARGMDMLRGMGGTVERASRGGPGFWALGTGLVMAAFWMSGGHSLFGSTGIAAPRSLTKQPLAIENVQSRVEDHDGRGILFVDGEARNRGVAALTVPPIAIAITDGAGITSRYFLGTSDTVLGPGERFAFSSRVETPSNGVKAVTVTFREDMN